VPAYAFSQLVSIYRSSIEIYMQTKTPTRHVRPKDDGTSSGYGVVPARDTGIGPGTAKRGTQGPSIGRYDRRCESSFECGLFGLKYPFKKSGLGETRCTFLRCLVASGLWRTERVNDELCDFPGPIAPSKSSLQILWLLPENTHLETKRGNEGKPKWERAKTRTFPSTSRG
jgi:hypothetical protein